jgi:UDP-N-acetylglucosamine acyltransferase
MISRLRWIHPKASLGKGVAIGPFTIISPSVEIGNNVKIGPYVFIDENVTIDEGCEIGPGVIIGKRPFDLNYQGEPTQVRIGKHNIIGEYTTIHRATGENNATVIGDDNLIMAYVHIGHNCQIGNNVVITNGSQLGGYVKIGDFANIGGMVGIHQWTRVGEYAMVGAYSYLVKDLPPFLIGQGIEFRVRGLNLVGLRRAGFSQERIGLLTKAYRLIYRSNLNLSDALTKIKQELPMTDDLKILLDFIQKSKRGVCLKQ